MRDHNFMALGVVSQNRLYSICKGPVATICPHFSCECPISWRNFLYFIIRIRMDCILTEMKNELRSSANDVTYTVSIHKYTLVYKSLMCISRSQWSLDIDYLGWCQFLECMKCAWWSQNGSRHATNPCWSMPVIKLQILPNVKKTS